MTNVLRTTVLLAALTALFLVIGGAIGGNQGLFIAFVFALLMNFASYWFSDKIVLSMYGAREVSLNEAPDLYRLVQRLAQRAGIPMPRVYIIPSDAPNAFATGRNPQHGAVAVTEGILRMLDTDELAGVLAHELGHIRNRDTLIMTVAATLAGAITMLAHMAQWGAIFGFGRRDEEDSGGGGILGLLFMAILAPIAATLIQLAISRSREYFADSTGAAVAGSPSGLARALEKLHYASQRLPMDANPATAHLFIVNPLTGGSLVNLFSTHPPIEERIRRLRHI
jgi:heat shock protein HtpX